MATFTAWESKKLRLVRRMHCSAAMPVPRRPWCVSRQPTWALLGVAAALMLAAGSPAMAGSAKGGAAVARKSRPTAPARTARPPGRLQRMKASLGQVRVVASFGVRAGLVGVTGAGGEAGLLVRTREEAKTARRVSLFGASGGSIGIGGVKGYLSHDRSLNGYEYNLGPGSKKSPIHGDKLGVKIIPGILGLSASRKGGIGFTFSGLPLWFGRYPLVWGSVSFYVAHPALAPLSNKVLDKADAAMSKLGRWVSPVGRAAKRWLGPPARFVKHAAGAPWRRIRPGKWPTAQGPHQGPPRPVVETGEEFGKGKTSVVNLSRDGRHVIKRFKPVMSRVRPLEPEARAELVKRTVAAMDALRERGVPVPDAWIGAPDEIVQERAEGLALRELPLGARLRARAAAVVLIGRSAGILWRRGLPVMVDLNLDNMRFHADGRIAAWFDPAIPVSGRTYLKLYVVDPIRRKRGATPETLQPLAATDL